MGALWFLLAIGALAACGAAEAGEAVSSPGGAGRVEVAAGADGESGALTFRVLLGEREIIAPSAMSVRFADGTVLGGRTTIDSVERRVVREEFEQFPGKRRRVEIASNEMTLALREGGDGGGRRWGVVVRVADDGAALRYRFPADPGGELALAEERTTFRVPAGAMVTALPLGSFTTSHEAVYERRLAGDLPRDRLMGPPLLVEVAGAGCAAILEANLKDYAGMYLAREGAASGAA